MADFKVGELALVVSSPSVSPELRGAIVEIIQLESLHYSPIEGHHVLAYVIDGPGGEWCAKREYLQKLPPPKQSDREDLQKVSWEEQVWQPRKLKALSF